tara:strand:+ start:218 stop:421 length:204 start_codon:yes stop_codon:yes gene_type:complete
MNDLNMRINLNDAEDVTCDNCGSTSFEQVYEIKKISAFSSPTGEEMYLPSPMFRCIDCQHVNDGFRD